MALRTIPFPGLHVATRQGGLELSLQASVALNLPESLPDVLFYSDLANTLQDDQLWVARHGASHFTVELTNDSSHISALERVMVTDWIERHEIWNRLGLRLVCSALDYDPSEISWSIQHPDLNSTLTAPSEALTAGFVGVKCVIDLKRAADVRQNEGKKTKKRKTNEVKVEAPPEDLQDVGDQDHGLIEGDIYDTLDPADQKMIDEFLEGFHVPQEGTREGNRKRKGDTSSRSVEHIEDARALLEGSIDIVLLGGSKRVNGLKVLEGTETQGLAQLLPGVFHMPHLKVISERASHLSVIAKSLARMTNAESPNLRRKANNFKYGLPLLDINISESEKVTRGIEKATWCSLLKNIKPSALKTKSSSRPAAQQPATPASSGSREATLVLGEMFGSQAPSSSQRSTLERWNPRMRPGTPVGETLGTPMRTPQERREPMLKLFLDSSPAVNTSSGVASPLSTPIPQNWGSSTNNSPSIQSHWGFPPRASTPVESLQQQNVPGFVNSTQHYPSASQDQNYYPVASHEQNFYPMSLDATQNAINVADPTNFGSFEDFLGDISMTNWDSGI